MQGQRTECHCSAPGRPAESPGIGGRAAPLGGSRPRWPRRARSTSSSLNTVPDAPSCWEPRRLRRAMGHGWGQVAPAGRAHGAAERSAADRSSPCCHLSPLRGSLKAGRRRHRGQEAPEALSPWPPRHRSPPPPPEHRAVVGAGLLENKALMFAISSMRWQRGRGGRHMETAPPAPCIECSAAGVGLGDAGVPVEQRTSPSTQRHTCSTLSRVCNAVIPPSQTWRSRRQMGITHRTSPKATSTDPRALRTSGASQRAMGNGAGAKGPGSSPPPPPPPPPAPAPASAQPIVSSSGPWNEINK